MSASSKGIISFFTILGRIQASVGLYRIYPFKKAGYSAPGASIEDICFLPERKLDQAQILRLASCTYIREAQNVIILGATGTGKTYLACALGMAANTLLLISIVSEQYRGILIGLEIDIYNSIGFSKH